MLVNSWIVQTVYREVRDISLTRKIAWMCFANDDLTCTAQLTAVDALIKEAGFGLQQCIQVHAPSHHLRLLLSSTPFRSHCPYLLSHSPPCCWCSCSWDGIQWPCHLSDSRCILMRSRGGAGLESALLKLAGLKKKRQGKKKSPSPLHFKSPPSPFSPHLSSSSSLSSLWNNRENGSCKRQTRVEKQGEEKGQTRRCKQRTEVREMVTWERDGWRGKENESR